MKTDKTPRLLKGAGKGASATDHSSLLVIILENNKGSLSQIKPDVKLSLKLTGELFDRQERQKQNSRLNQRMASDEKSAVEYEPNQLSQNQP